MNTVAPTTAAPEEEVGRLRSRLKRLAEDKAYLQLVIRMIERIDPAPGVADMVGNLLHNIVESIGGTDIKIWYWMDGRLHYQSHFGGRDTPTQIDDPLAREAVQGRRFIERQGSEADSLLRGEILPGSYTWAFPLMVSDTLVGVIKLENIHIYGASLRQHLPIFFSHAALILNTGIRNQSSLRQAYDELRASHERLRKTQHSIDQAALCVFWIVPESARFSYVNQRVCDVLGYSREEMLDGMTVADIDPNWPTDRWPEHLAELRKTKSMQLRTDHRKKNGEVFPVEVTVYLSEFEGEEHMVSFATDIRDRIASEEAMKAALAAAESANRMKSVFLANMSHELRTPLNAILGFAQIMERDPRIPDDERENLRTINRSGPHLLTLINDVLEISRIEAGRMHLQDEPCDLRELAHSLVELMRPRAQAKGLELRVRIDPDTPRYVMTDTGKLRQILLNLISNATKYTATGHIELDLSCLQPPGVAPRLRLRVTDTGIGIAESEQERIFDPFYQTEHGIALGEGTGLGLTISREYARLMGGQLEVESRPGRGASFCLSLPCQPSQAIQTVEAGHGRVIGLADDQPPPRVLVAEDDADSRRLLEILLGEAGFNVRSVADGDQAVREFTRWRPDFIWMDMRMPVLDGYAATRAIRALPNGQAPRIVALTASAFQEDRAAILAAGCDAVMTKPLDEGRLFEMMREQLDLHYRYIDSPEVTGPAAESAPLTLPDSFPEPQRAALAAAAEILDVEDCRRLLAQLKTSDPALAGRLLELVNNYQFERLQELCKKT